MSALLRATPVIGASPLLSIAEREAFLDAYDRYFVCRTMIRSAGGRLSPYNDAEGTTFSMCKDRVQKSRVNIDRQHAIRMLHEIRNVIYKPIDTDITKRFSILPREVLDALGEIPGIVIACFVVANCRPPSLDLCRQLSTSFNDLRKRVDEVQARLVSGPQVEPASPVARALVGSEGRVPAARAKLPDLAQMQFDRAPGANQAGSNETAYKVSIKIGEQPDNIGGVDVAFGVRVFQISLRCAEAVPSLAPGLSALTFYSGGRVRQAKVTDDFPAGSLLRDRTYRIEADEGPDVLVGHSDSETLFIVAGGPLPGDEASLEIRPFNLKVRVVDPSAKLEDNEARRIAENWLRAQLYEGAELPLTIALCHQELAS